MPTTRKKTVKPVYKEEDGDDDETGDFSDSGSEASIPKASESSEEGNQSEDASSGDDFKGQKKPSRKPVFRRKANFAKSLYSKASKASISQLASDSDNDESRCDGKPFNIKDLSEENKLLPSILNLSESDSSDDETEKKSQKTKKHQPGPSQPLNADVSNSEEDDKFEEVPGTEYKDVWNQNSTASEEIAKSSFAQFSEHVERIEEVKASLKNYENRNMEKEEQNINVKDLLALGEDPIVNIKKKVSKKNKEISSESEMEDWEEVKESKQLPQSGIQLVVDFPEAERRKAKTLDLEMMMKRKINRARKEYQVFMHKVHILCWIGHGNYVNSVLNDQDVMSAALSLLPSAQSYPSDKVDQKYLEQISKWFLDKITIKEDLAENKYKPNAPPLKVTLLKQIKLNQANSKKNKVLIFLSILRALGIKCRMMLNFVVVPLKPSATELCSLSTKAQKDNKNIKSEKANSDNVTDVNAKPKCSRKLNTKKIDKEKPKNKKVKVEKNISQLDGNDDSEVPTRKRSARLNKISVKDLKSTSKLSSSIKINVSNQSDEELVSPTKKSKTAIPSSSKSTNVKTKQNCKTDIAKKSSKHFNITENEKKEDSPPKRIKLTDSSTTVSSRNLRIRKIDKSISNKSKNGVIGSTFFNEKSLEAEIKSEIPRIVITSPKLKLTRLSLNRKRTLTSPKKHEAPEITDSNKEKSSSNVNPRARTRSAPDASKSKYFENKTPTQTEKRNPPKEIAKRTIRKCIPDSDDLRVSHRDLVKMQPSQKNQILKSPTVKNDLIKIMKKKISESKVESKNKLTKDKRNDCSDSEDDSDYLPEEETIEPRKSRKESNSDIDFKPPKSKKKKIDRRVLSTDDEGKTFKQGLDIWCEVYVDSQEEWICIDVINGIVNSPSKIYAKASHPVTYIVGWDSSSYVKDLTRRYVPHWNTVTRKLRVHAEWWEESLKPWEPPPTQRDIKEDHQLDRLQMDAPMPTAISEFKNHPLYALQRHLLKFEALYPPDAVPLGFVRGEPIYLRSCVYVCRSRDIWLKEAKVVKLGEKPYKIVKARPKWDRLSNKMITDKPLEIFGPWQVEDYKPPNAENGVVPRSAYGSVDLFKSCMLPGGTVHLQLPGLNKVAKKLNIDCAPALTGFDFHGGWSHPVYDGFVVCSEFQEILTDAWVKDQEESEKRERDKIESRVYGNWRKLIRGLFIRERLRAKYAFEDPKEEEPQNTSKKKKCSKT